MKVKFLSLGLYFVLAITDALAQGTQVREPGNLVVENIPPVDTPLTARLEEYMNARGASFVDWMPDGSLLISTRFGDVEQIHRVAGPLADREQLTFYKEPVTIARSPQSPVAAGFVFLKDQGGNENAQLHWFDTATRAVRQLTDGKGLYGGVNWSHDGRRIAFHGTGRDGVSYDLYIAEPANKFAAPRLVYNGFQKNWSVQDWSPDDSRLLIVNRVSANEGHLYVMDVATAALTPVRFAISCRSWPSTSCSTTVSACLGFIRPKMPCSRSTSKRASMPRSALTSAPRSSSRPGSARKILRSRTRRRSASSATCAATALDQLARSHAPPSERSDSTRMMRSKLLCKRSSYSVAL